MNTKQLVHCEWCGKAIFKTPYQLSKAKHHFCNNTCSHEWRHEQATVVCVCRYCGKEFKKRRSSPQRFCSVDCHNMWQKENALRGSDHPRAKRATVSCDWCGKFIEIHEHELAEHQNHFCSLECRRVWYAKIWSQKADWKNSSRIRAAEILKRNNGITKTRPQMIVNNMLLNLNINFENEKTFKYYSVDNYLTDFNLIIEVMGDYWHGNPNNQVSLNEIQIKNKRRDSAKHTFILNYYNIQILYLWENDIIKCPEKCYALIKKYVDSKGQLSNYHSYNYQLQEGYLSLSENII